MNDDGFLTIMIFGVLVVASFMIVYTFVENFNKNRIFNYNYDVLENMNLDIMKGQIESPSIIIDMDTFQDFLNKIDELNEEKIYYHGLKFYVFEDSYLIAYRYSPEVFFNVWRNDK